MPIQSISFYGARQILPESIATQDDHLQWEESYILSGATRAVGEKKKIQLGPDKLVELVFDDNTTWLCHADSLEEVFPEAANPIRSADGSFELPASLRSTGGERSLVSDIALKAVNLFTKKVIAKTVHELAQDLEQKQLGGKSGLYRLDKSFALLDGVVGATEKPYLLFLHGTSSSTEGSFGKLAQAETWTALLETYGDNILAFQHETLSKSPLQNVADLVKSLPEKATLHLVTHSRGGLVGDLLSRFCNSNADKRGFDANELAYLEKTGRSDDLKCIAELNAAFGRKTISVSKFVRVACPANGTILASKRLDNFFNITANLIGFGTGIAASPVYAAFRSLIAGVVDSKNNPESLPGIEAMNPDSPFIKVLNTPASTIEIEDPLVIISGNCKAGFNLKSLLIIASKLFYFTDNDLVVNTASMYQGARRHSKLTYLFDDAGNVDHFHYFQNDKTRAALLAALREGGDLLSAGFKTAEQASLAQRERNIQILGLDGGELAESTVSGTRPIVVLLPGIMGSNLSQNGDKIWIDYKDFLLGGLGKLKFSNQNIEALSIVKTSYGRLAVYLKRTYDVVTFAYDWRQPLTVSAKRFRDKIESLLKLGQPIKIIGHSMGGVLVRDFILNHEDTWKKLNASKDFRLIFLGAPLGGSYRIPSVLLGKDSIIGKLSMIDIVHTKKQLLQIFSRFPGLLSLLPLSTNLDNDFARALTWKRMAEALGDSTWPLPPEGDADLDWFQAYREKALTGMPGIDFSNTCYVAGKDKATPCAYRIDETAQGRDLVFLSTAEGDQSVTWETGIPQKLIDRDAVYYVNVTHGSLANTPEIFDGLAELLASGATRLFSKTRPAVRGEEKLFKSPEIRDFDLSEAGIEKTILGLEAQEPETTVERPVIVSVSNGDLHYASYPILAGHFLKDGILNAEATIDKMLGGALSERHRLGVYPGEIGTSKIHFSADGKGAIIVGLGSFGSLTASLLTQTVEQGVASYLLDVNDRIKNAIAPKPASMGISTLLIASGYGGFSIENSAAAIIQGVQNANAKIEKLKEDSCLLISSIEFVELYEDRSLSCFYALSKMARTQAGGPKVHFDKKEIRRLFGAKQRIPFESSEAWWNRITVEVDEKTAGSKTRQGFSFTASTLGAREESRSLFINPAGLENLINESADGNRWSPRLGKTLFEMLLPVDFKEQFKKRFNINWVLDSYAAALPWELLQDNASEAKPLCVNAGMIRQLVTKDYRQKINAVVANNALVVGEPDLNGFLPDLPGAYQEGMLVAGKLEKNGLKVQALLRRSSAEILPALHADDYKIIHLAGHGSFNKDEPESSGMVIGENSFLTTADIENMSTVPELVFVNCCFLGRTDPAAEEYFQNAYRLAANMGTQLIRNGVKAVVVAGWAVNDDAAYRFTEVFYQNMFEAECFGDAVRRARSAVYDEFHSISNTWGAYQCYGDPFYKFHSERSSGEEQPKEFVIAQEAIIELNNLQSKLQTGKYAQASIMKQVLGISKSVDAAAIRNALITEKEALIYAALFEYEKAIEKFESLLSLERADFAVSTLEKYSNVLMKKYVADYNEALRKGKAVTKEKLKEWLARADNVISGLESLLLISPTAERYSLLGSAYKRKALLCSGLAEKRKANATAAWYYRQAHQLEGNHYKAYALTNWYELESILVLTGNRKWGKKAEADGQAKYDLPQKNEVIRQLNKVENALEDAQDNMDYWLLTEKQNYLLCHLLVEGSGNGKAKWTELETAYRKVWATAGSKGDKYAEIEHLQLLLDALSMNREKNSLLKENLENLKSSLEKML